MLTLTDEQALAHVSRQGFGSPKDYGPKAPTTVKALLGFLHAARVRGYAMIDEVFAPGMAAVAAPVQRAGRPAVGVISIAGPRRRLTMPRMLALVPALLARHARARCGEQRIGSVLEAAARQGLKERMRVGAFASRDELVPQRNPAGSVDISPCRNRSQAASWSSATYSSA